MNQNSNVHLLTACHKIKIDDYICNPVVPKLFPNYSCCLLIGIILFDLALHLIEETLTGEKHKPWTMRPNWILGKQH